jgi:acyl-CoA synthetase (AMP-forming)/AMP-acid ligase II
MQGVQYVPLPGLRFQILSAAVMGRGSFSPADLGRLDDSGELVLQGRVGRVVKVGGRRLDLAGLETELGGLPGIRGVVADLHVGHRDLIAAMVATDLSLADVRQVFLERMAAWKIPGRIVVVRELPLTARGKVDRKKAESQIKASAR